MFVCPEKEHRVSEVCLTYLKDISIQNSLLITKSINWSCEKENER